MYFILMAGWCWLSALCGNMAIGFRLQVLRSRGGGRKRFLALSAFAWGLPTVLTFVYAHVLGPKDSLYNIHGSHGSTRLCYNELFIRIIEETDTGRKRVYEGIEKRGTALFYYGRVCCLLLCNLICLSVTLRKMQYLRRGNSVLRRAEDQSAQRLPETKGHNPPAASRANDNGRTGKIRSGVGRNAAIDAKTIKLYTKVLLMSGGIELITEVIMWSTTHHSFHDDRHFPYRAAGYVTDLLRAVCVAWMAAPERGYLGLILRLARGDKKKQSPTLPDNAGRKK